MFCINSSIHLVKREEVDNFEGNNSIFFLYAKSEYISRRINKETSKKNRSVEQISIKSTVGGLPPSLVITVINYYKDQYFGQQVTKVVFYFRIEPSGEKQKPIIRGKFLGR